MNQYKGHKPDKENYAQWNMQVLNNIQKTNCTES
jgi:hypothetical protein